MSKAKKRHREALIEQLYQQVVQLRKQIVNLKKEKK